MRKNAKESEKERRKTAGAGVGIISECRNSRYRYRPDYQSISTRGMKEETENSMDKD